MNDTAIAITGIGVVSPLGVGFDSFAEAATLGVVGLDVSADLARLSGQVVDFDPNAWFIAEKTYLDRCSELALAATRLCLDHAGLEAMPAESERSGLVLGTMLGCLGTMEAYAQRVRKRGPRFATPLLFSHSFANTPTSLICIDYRLKGYGTTITSGDTSGSLALDTACVGLLAGHADAVLAGGVDAFSPEVVELVGDRYAAADDPDDYDPYAADGLVLGEGAALFLLERRADAEARGATIHALLESPVDSSRPDLTLLPARGEPCGGAGPGSPATCAPAGLYGHALGAAGALSAALAVAALQTGVVPPVRGGGEPLAARREPREVGELRRVRVMDRRAPSTLDTPAGDTAPAADLVALDVVKP